MKKIITTAILLELAIAIPLIALSYAWSIFYNVPRTITVTGEFYCDIEDAEGETLYQFRSYDDSIWWLLTEEEIGSVPEQGIEYALTYSDNGTAKCECSPDCECAVYDDNFISLRRIGRN